MAITRDELDELVKELDAYKARATELITVYIPAGQNIYTVADQLEAEKSTAKNIKSTSTRKNVGNALDKITRALKDYKKTPENGLALFSGNISEIEGQEDLRIWNFEPSTPLKVRMYRCDKEFILDPLKEMLSVTEVFGLLVMDRKEATIGLLEGKHIEVLQKMTSGIPSKVRAGGQCLSPDTLIETKNGSKKIKEIEIDDEIKALDLINKEVLFSKVKNKWEVNRSKYFEIKVDDCWSIISSEDHTFFKDIGKEGFKIKEILAKNLKIGDWLITFDKNKKLFTMEIKDIQKVNQKINLIDIETEAGNFFAEGLLVHNSSQRFHRITEGLTKEFYNRIADEMKKIFYEMPKLKGILVGGPIPTKDEFLDGEYLPSKLQNRIIGVLDLGDTSESGLKELVEKARDILVGQELVYEKKVLEKFFRILGERPDIAALKEPETRKALEYGAVDTLVISKEINKFLAKELVKLAENIGASVEMISTETEEGQQFKNMGGIGAILRFKVH